MVLLCKLKVAKNLEVCLNLSPIFLPSWTFLYQSFNWFSFWQIIVSFLRSLFTVSLKYFFGVSGYISVFNAFCSQYTQNHFCDMPFAQEKKSAYVRADHRSSHESYAIKSHILMKNNSQSRIFPDKRHLKPYSGWHIVFRIDANSDGFNHPTFSGFRSGTPWYIKSEDRDVCTYVAILKSLKSVF